jgi:hypothetical protein
MDAMLKVVGVNQQLKNEDRRVEKHNLIFFKIAKCTHIFLELEKIKMKEDENG